MDISINHINLYAEAAGEGRPLLMLHGFTGSSATWRPLVGRLGPGIRSIAVDLIGHGKSSAPARAARYSMARCVADLLALLDKLNIARATVLGYSMGGRVALQLAAAAPQRVEALVLESASPGLASADERAARAAADDALADTIEREGLAAFVDYWEQLPLWASQAALPPEARARLRAQRLRNNPRGLANSLRGMGAGRQTSLWEQLGALGMPALLLAGALDGKYSAIARRMAGAMPRARLAIVPDAGHAIHLEQPDVFIEQVADFLRSPDAEMQRRP
ncbi:2-succinyl-6-hydroxy-2,4-cyclohexadiene-1-carboxylate synthase [Kouleothrix sp.]|uniref:2-succinyl-6-hydroxy-2, 4-cyclohexadiene-1-carboxylate synthase n=1 Tax=Kouleothrix sp. TaxID=2779161 RepID=UPI00391D1277